MPMEGVGKYLKGVGGDCGLEVVRDLVVVVLLVLVHHVPACCRHVLELYPASHTQGAKVTVVVVLESVMLLLLLTLLPLHNEGYVIVAAADTVAVT